MTDFFSPDYFAARARFRSGVLDDGGQLESIALDARGPGQQDLSQEDLNEEALSIDVGWFGSPEPRRAFIHSSGLRGVEGFAGSAIQLQWLELNPPEPPAGSAVVIVHALNPFGMAWLRRTDEDNIDLNCNFLASDEEYAGGRDFSLFRRRVLTECQYEFPASPGFGGKRHAQATRRFQLYIAGKLAFAEHVAAIDVRTGPGRFGEDRLVCDQTKGSLGSLYARIFPGAKVDFAVQEFGSCGRIAAILALRNEKRQLRTFCPPGKKWREQVLINGKEVIERSLARLNLRQPYGDESKSLSP